MKKRYIVLISLVVIVSFIYGSVKVHAWMNGPHLNPHPKYFVTISGNIQPGMKRPVYMRFIAKYGGYKCSVTVNLFAGVMGVKAKTDFYPVHPDKEGNYTVKIPIDKYKPEKCGWKIAYINFNFQDTPIVKKVLPDQSIIYFGKADNENEQAGYPIFSNNTAYNCNFGLLTTCEGSTLMAQYVDFVSRKKNYHFTQNFKE